MAFVTLRFHYTIFHRQIQHIFEIFGTLRYKSTRSIRHKSHKPTFMKTFYRQSYENFCQTEYFPEICEFMQCRRTARFGCAKTREAAACRRFAAVRCADCGACAVAGLHYPRRFAGEALSRLPRRFAAFGILARNQKPRARRRGLPSRGGTLPQAMPFRRTSRLSQSPTPLPPRQTPQADVVQIRAAGARRVLAAPKRAKRRQAAASLQSAARTAARAPSSSQQKRLCAKAQSRS